MSGTMALRQVEELAEALPLPEQQRLIERMTRRLQARQEGLARAEAFLKTCMECPVHPTGQMDAGEEIARMRQERGDNLS